MRRNAAAGRRISHTPSTLRGRSHPKAVLACASALLTLVHVLAISPTSARQEVPVPRTLEDPSVAPVVGPSWLTRRGVAYDRTTVGVATRDGLTGDQLTESPRQPLATLPRVVLDGETLYRLNCLACHREERLGAPSAPSAVLRTVVGVSLEVIKQRLRASVTRTNLPGLIRHGTVLMPAREHLKDDDLDMLLDYLTEAADPIETTRRARRVGSWARLGEHLVKGTCHICHDAVGPRTSLASVQKGEIPSLEALLGMRSVTDFVRKARSGLPVTIDELGLFHAGRMPTFDYLRDDEVAAAYLYLATYPPMAERR